MLDWTLTGLDGRAWIEHRLFWSWAWHDLGMAFLGWKCVGLGRVWAAHERVWSRAGFAMDYAGQVLGFAGTGLEWGWAL